MSSRKIAIFHFRPLELYPPVINLLNYLDNESEDDISIRVYTTWPEEKMSLFELQKGKNIQIIRSGKLDPKSNIFYRYFQYIRHTLVALFNIFKWTPDSIFYFETSSSIVPLLWLSFLKKKANLFIHYHEYMSKAEYSSNKLLNFLNKKEVLLYPSARWISHTNKNRCDLFIMDTRISDISSIRVLPNYPPGNWVNQRVNKLPCPPKRIVYVGALGLDSMFVRELVEWVENKQGVFTWDIYSQQDLSELKSYLESIGSRHVKLKGYINYAELPEVLSSYHIGVIIYKSNSENFIFNAPNKLFEYLICDLDVWYPDYMQGINAYIEMEKRPRVIPVKFSSKDSIDYAALLSKDFESGTAFYSAEDALLPLRKELFNTGDYFKI